jgi:nucleoside-diphosphate-sugar epimerase
MRILLTGGSGFVGSYVAEQLAEQGHTVRALVRPRSDRRLLQPLPRIEFALGAVEQPESLGEAVRDCSVVVHVAGLVKARKPQEFFDVNAEGTKHLLEAAIWAGGVRRFVYVSSLTAAGPSLDGHPIPDDAAPNPVTNYGRSKLAGELAVLAAQERIPVTVLRPPMVYGPRDRETLGFFTAIQNGTLPILGDGSNTLSIIYGSDCASAIVAAALSEGTTGRTYYTEDGTIHVWREALEEVERAMGKRAFFRAGVPMWTLKLVAGATQTWGKVSNTAQMLTLDKVNELQQKHWVCSSSRLRTDLGWYPKVTWAEGVRLAIDWYRREKWL